MWPATVQTGCGACFPSKGCACRWNPAVEQQAQDRIHRLGQFKPIHVTRFIIAGTIEERILKLQVRPLTVCQTSEQG